jgi:hypothetical protein
MTNTDKKESEWPNEDRVIYIPDEYIRDIENSLDKMKQARQEFGRVKEELTDTRSVLPHRQP